MRTINPTLPFLIVMLLGTPLNGCESHVMFPIQEDEMVIPDGKYQAGGDMWSRNQVRMQSIETKPEEVWTKGRDDLHMDPFCNVLVDCEGGICYKASNSRELLEGGINAITSEALGRFVYKPKIVRLDSHGDKFWERKLNLDDKTNLDVPFMSVMLDGAVVFSVSYVEEGEEGEDAFFTYLECIDINGVTRWQTDPIENDSFRAGTWRTDFDRIIMSGADETLKVYAIFNGDLMDTIQTPGLMPLDSRGPLPVRGDCLVMYGIHATKGVEYIAELDYHDNCLSYFEYPNDTMTITPISAEECIVYFGNADGLRKINIDTQETIWTRYKNHYVVAAGMTPYGNVLGIVHDRRDGPSELKLITSDGGEIWSHTLESSSLGPVDTVIYKDNAILVSHCKGLTMLSPDGTIRWSVSSLDMRFPRNTVFTFLKAYPVTLGGLFLHYQLETDDGSLDEGLIRLQGDD